MIFLAITPAGLAEALREATPDDAVWCSADAISDAAFKSLGATNLTRFVHTLSGADSHDALAAALDTIDEHHPGQVVWIEGKGRE